MSKTEQAAVKTREAKPETLPQPRASSKGQAIFIVDRSKPFDAARLTGRDWSIVEEDQRALDLPEVDFSKVRFESGLKENESVITGEMKLKNLRDRTEIRLDAKFGQDLYEEEDQETLRWLYDTYGVRWFECAGTVLQHGSDLDRSFLCLYRQVDGSWLRGVFWLRNGRDRENVSPLLAP